MTGSESPTTTPIRLLPQRPELIPRARNKRLQPKPEASLERTQLPALVLLGGGRSRRTVRGRFGVEARPKSGSRSWFEATIPRASPSTLVKWASAGAPSTIYAIARGQDPLESTRAIGSVVINSEENTALLAAAVPVHIAISLWWAIVLARLLPLRRRLLAGGLIGAAIAVLDLRVIGRAFPRILRLPLGLQIADHDPEGDVVAALRQPRD